MDETLEAYHRAPDELISAPESLLGPGRRRAPRPPRIEEGTDTPQKHVTKMNERLCETQHFQTLDTVPPMPKRKARKDEYPILDSCANDAHRIGPCRIRLPDGRIAALPPNPKEICKELCDDDHELVLVELRNAEHETVVPWLDDEQVDTVLVHQGSLTKQVPREVLRAHVMKKVPLKPCTRNLSRAVYKLCAPFGPKGPLVTLVPSDDAIGLCQA